MENADIMYDHLRAHEPFAFSKFNDGEHALLAPNSIASRECQNTSERLRVKLFEALIWTHPRYYLGTVCSRCYTEAHRIDSFLRGKDKMNVLANTLINSNVRRTVEVLKETLPTYTNIVYVGSENANPNAIETYFNIKFSRVYKVKNKDGFESGYDMLKSETFEPGTMVLLCCGPLGRVLAYEWFRANPAITCLELGSLFDPLTQKKLYMYHYGNFPVCPECNPTVSEGVFLDNVDKTFYFEYYYMTMDWCLNKGHNPPEALRFLFEKKEMHAELALLECFLAKNEDEKKAKLRAMHDTYKDWLDAGFELYTMTNNFDILRELYYRRHRQNVQWPSCFANKEIYDWKIDIEMCFKAWYNSELGLGIEACNHILSAPGIPDHVRDIARYNIKWYEK